MRNEILSAIAAAAITLGSRAATATADGPDIFQVTGVGAGDVLNIRTEPDPRVPKGGEIQPAGTCIRSLGCRGGLSFQEFEQLTPDEQAQRLKENPRWCRIEYKGVTGWVSESMSQVWRIWPLGATQFGIARPLCFG